MNVIAISQARTGSTRFPNKILQKVNGESLLSIHIRRIKNSKKINFIIIATTNKKGDDVVEDEANNLSVKCFRGSEEDVLDRFYQAAKPYNPDYVVRLTSDCPLIDPNLIDKIIKIAIKSEVDYCSNTLVESYPDGQDIEVFSFSSLEKAWNESKLNSEREHVTPYMKKNLKTLNIHSNNMNYNKVRMTVDVPPDFQVIKKMIKKLGVNDSWQNYTKLYLNEKKIHSLNNSILRNEGYLKSVKNDLIN
tara:strand:+ start:7258 stop:8001 length:744 start_codon:yes stop_codon:yes gene_type:complete